LLFWQPYADIIVVSFAMVVQAVATLNIVM